VYPTRDALEGYNPEGSSNDGSLSDAVLEDAGPCAWHKGLTMKDDPRQSYVLGHGSEEHRRLMLQSRFVGELTEAVFARAGLAQGMRVLDVGCGAGDVSLLAAAFVGAGGSVLGIDQSPESVSLARERAKAAGLDNVRFEVARLEELRAGGPFDALVGRLVLLYLKEPAVVLPQLAVRVRPGGFILFIDM
jgi:2-polyprenyl-3-methyl-5-hydroxy-6-metoxy-1,4-benzoquinol methylase